MKLALSLASAVFPLVVGGLFQEFVGGNPDRLEARSGAIEVHINIIIHRLDGKPSQEGSSRGELTALFERQRAIHGIQLPHRKVLAGTLSVRLCRGRSGKISIQLGNPIPVKPQMKRGGKQCCFKLNEKTYLSSTSLLIEKESFCTSSVKVSFLLGLVLFVTPNTKFFAALMYNPLQA